MPIYHLKISGKDKDAMFDLVRKYRIAVARNTITQTDAGYTVYADADGNQIRRLTSAGYEVERIEDSRRAGKARQREIRNPEKGAPPADESLDLTDAGGYMTVDDVEKMMSAIHRGNPGFTSLIHLPNHTWENRLCTALKIGHGIFPPRPGILLLGGIHAREWGSPDILLNFALRLVKSYATNTGLTLGPLNLSALKVRSLVNSKDIYVFPQVNPDGRKFSMTTDSMWRKNRRPAPAGHPQSSCIGVDINRNYDFLWDFPLYFAPNAPVTSSKNPCDYQVYSGPSAASEPETKNVVWLLDNFANIRYLVDYHSYSETILYNWGDDTNQTSDPQMNFHNPVYNGKRGIIGDALYSEYFNATDKAFAIKLATVMQKTIKAVRGRVYSIQQSSGLYPIAGGGTDYAYARHILIPMRPKVMSFTIEWGSSSNPTPFHPPFAEMQNIITEISAATLAFCMNAT
jgi:carboxypeptidase T